MVLLYNMKKYKIRDLVGIKSAKNLCPHIANLQITNHKSQQRLGPQIANFQSAIGDPARLPAQLAGRSGQRNGKSVW
jgi:hypothetical protein